MASKIRKTISSGQLITDVPHFVNEDGHYIFCKYWEPAKPPTALVCIIHGYGEHCARYEEFAQHLNEIGAYVFSQDNVGHGESEGEGWYLTDYTCYARDAMQHVDIMRKKFPDLPIFLFGHSFGGSSAILAAHESTEIFRGVIVTAPAILESKELATPFRLFLLRAVVRLFPRMSLGSMEATWLTRDPEEVQRSIDDPLGVPHGILAKTAETSLKMTTRIREILEEINFPFLVIHGDADKITPIEGSIQMHDKVKSKDKTIKIYSGQYHNLSHEIKEDRITHFHNITAWIEERI